MRPMQRSDSCPCLLFQLLAAVQALSCLFVQCYIISWVWQGLHTQCATMHGCLGHLHGAETCCSMPCCICQHLRNRIDLRLTGCVLSWLQASLRPTWTPQVVSSCRQVSSLVTLMLAHFTAGLEFQRLLLKCRKPESMRTAACASVHSAARSVAVTPAWLSIV